MIAKLSRLGIGFGLLIVTGAFDGPIEDYLVGSWTCTVSEDGQSTVAQTTYKDDGTSKTTARAVISRETEDGGTASLAIDMEIDGTWRVEEGATYEETTALKVEHYTINGQDAGAAELEEALSAQFVGKGEYNDVEIIDENTYVGTSRSDKATTGTCKRK